jgi:ParB/RepB/Spo0J family partition protein
METTVINATEYRNVSLALLSESKTNPRRIFEDAALKELAESIRTQGVLSPLLVRPLTENGFEIVARAIANATGIRVLKAIGDARTGAADERRFALCPDADLSASCKSL